MKPSRPLPRSPMPLRPSEPEWKPPPEREPSPRLLALAQPKAVPEPESLPTSKPSMSSPLARVSSMRSTQSPRLASHRSSGSMRTTSPTRAGSMRVGSQAPNPGGARGHSPVRVASVGSPRPNGTAKAHSPQQRASEDPLPTRNSAGTTPRSRRPVAGANGGTASRTPAPASAAEARSAVQGRVRQQRARRPSQADIESQLAVAMHKSAALAAHVDGQPVETAPSMVEKRYVLSVFATTGCVPSPVVWRAADTFASGCKRRRTGGRVCRCSNSKPRRRGAVRRLPWGWQRSTRHSPGRRPPQTAGLRALCGAVRPAVVLAAELPSLGPHVQCTAGPALARE